MMLVHLRATYAHSLARYRWEHHAGAGIAAPVRSIAAPYANAPKDAACRVYLGAKMLRPLAVVALSSLLAGCASTRAAPPPAACPAAAAPAPAIVDGMVDVGGLSLHVHCMGAGAPTVLMESGSGGSGTVWQEVQPELAKLTRVCGYDRAGAGYSDTPPKPRAVAQITEEMHTLIARANLPGPLVLMGHSLGGLYIRLYAAQYPNDVVGMVLVDGSTEDQDVRMWSLMPPAVLAAAFGDPADREGVSLDALHVAMAQLRGANRSLGDKPLVVLTAGKSDPEADVSPEVGAQMAKIWQEMQAALPSLSTNSTQVIATKSHHFIQFEAPKLVIAAVQQVVGAVRTHGRIDAVLLGALAHYSVLPEAMKARRQRRRRGPTLVRDEMARDVRARLHGER